ncbi:fatty acid desaturase family protein [Pyxidicoccus xibeiensis]|uniref:fatty acid desaturase family protein n=1 Tax=Pyxidicoccus xibeiensis TaxID=2906759 RepID=UPI0020A7E641|nr:fatty acid desaturase [Pyxidicoccus xibeiensis]MCP3138677.1 fatty acid desaturase [Pyxidicoccus xibeiensis]
MRAVPQVDSPGDSGTAPEAGLRPGSIAARLRARYARHVVSLGYQPQSLPEALAHLGLHVALGVGAALATAAVMRWQPVAGWVLYPLAAFFIGTRFRALGNMLHEACHGMLVRGKRRNRVLGHVLAIIDLTALEPYTREHFTHHLHLGDPVKDLDFVPRRRFGFADPGRPFLRHHLLRPLLLVHLPAFLRPVLFHRTDPWTVTLARWGFVAGLVALAQWGIGWWAFLLFYALPYLVPYQVIRYWSDAVDHAGIIGSADEFHRSRNHLLPWAPLHRVFFPRHDQYHLTHHLFPAVPTAFQGHVHELLMHDPDYAAREHAFTVLLR